MHSTPSSSKTEVIDVELFAKQQEIKYAYDPESVIPIKAEEFRQSVRQSKGKEKNEDRAGRRSTSTIATPQVHVGLFGAPTQRYPERINHPSAIAPAMQDLRKKRSLSGTSPILTSATSLKRRRLESPVASSTPSSSTIPPKSTHSSGYVATQTPVPGSSKLESRKSLKRSSFPASDNASPKRQIIIELTSDGEEMTTTRPTKKPKRRECSTSVIEISDSDSDVVLPDPGFDAFFDALPIPELNLPELDIPELELVDELDDEADLNDPDRWKPIKVNENKLEIRDVVDNLSQIDNAQVWTPLRRKAHPDTSLCYSRPSSRAPEFIWNQVSHRIRKPRLPISALGWRSHLRNRNPNWPSDFGLSELKFFRSFKKSPGSINKIEQKGPWTVIASGSVGGLPDEPDEESNPFNRNGSLITYNVNGMFDIPTGHQGQKRGIVKHYAVHDVKFDPTRLSFVSTGADRKLRIWSPPDDDEPEADPNSMEGEPIIPSWRCSTVGTLVHVPHDLAFKPSSSILAVGEKKLHIYSFFENTYEHTRSYNHHPHKDHIVGSLVWGIQPTSHHLFTSSEPIDNGVFEGVHAVYDVDHETQLYKFDASEAGDTISVAPDGMTLALSTRGPEQSHILRLYDVARQHRAATTTVNLDRFPTHLDGEVNHAMFSPDGVYLSLARNDNHVHIYDMRYLSKGVIFDYAHSAESKAALQAYAYGVVKAQWIQSEQTSRIGLVTAGEDGCVRFWDPMKAAPNPKIATSDTYNGKVVAEVNSDIGHFSLGNVVEGEHRLVVGDCTGEVSFFGDIVI